MISFPLAAAIKKRIVEQVSFYPSDKFIKPKFMRTEHNVWVELLEWYIADTSNWQRQSVKQLGVIPKVATSFFCIFGETHRFYNKF